MRIMEKIKAFKYWAFMLSAFLWLAIDLAVKYFFAHAGSGSLVLIKNFFYFSYQTNKGVAFGIHLGYVFQLIASIIILALLIYFGIKYLLPEKRNAFLNQFLLGIIIGGALGNLINRILMGSVIDYIILKPFPVFNIADVGITIGLIALFLLTYNNKNDSGT
jgi:signal peptidase II